MVLGPGLHRNQVATSPENSLETRHFRHLRYTKADKTHIKEWVENVEQKEKTIGDEKTEDKDKVEEIKTALEEVRYIEGLLMGLFLGILGNLCVSFLIEMIHAFGTTLFYTWIVVFVLSLVVTVIVTLVLVKRIVVRILGIITTIFPPLKPKQKSD